MELILKRESWLKRYPIQSSEIEDRDKQLGFSGQRVPINWYVIEGSHLLVEVKSPISGRFNWYVFREHVTVEDAGKQVYPAAVTAEDGAILLRVPFFSQLETPTEPTFKTAWEQHRTCFTSAMAGVLKFLGVNISGDDEYYRILKKFGDTTSWEAQIAAARSLGVTCYKRPNADFSDLDHSLQMGKPVVIGILHRGSLMAPTGGHMLTVIGKTRSGDYYVNDSYGSLNDGYTGPTTNGCRAVYQRSTLKRRWTVEGPKSGWAMMFR